MAYNNVDQSDSHILLIKTKNCATAACCIAILDTCCHVQMFFHERWEKEVGNKLHVILPKIDDKYVPYIYTNDFAARLFAEYTSLSV